jgi:hypothetical protein
LPEEKMKDFVIEFKIKNQNIEVYMVGGFVKEKESPMLSCIEDRTEYRALNRPKK